MIRDRIYLVAGNVGYTASSGMTGDAANPDIYWSSVIIDTGTTINADGSLSGGNVITDADGTVLYKYDPVKEAEPLPNNRSLKLHVWQDNYDGSRVDNGFAGLIRAPGYYFSGYFQNSGGNITNVPSDAALVGSKTMDYFFVTGNWLNMQMVYNQYVYVKNQWVRAWEYCTFPKENYVPTVSFSLTSPNYENNYPTNFDSATDGSVNYVIYNGQSGSMRLHFSELILGAGDILELRDENSAIKATYSGATSQTDFWTDWVSGPQITLRFKTDGDADTVAKGWQVDTYQYQSEIDFQISSRLKVAQEAIIEVIESTRGKINWGISVFDQKYNSGSVELAPLNASFSDDKDKQNLINQLESATADWGTPLGESLQDIFTYFNKKVNQVHQDCNKNFVISLTDGFPSNDTDWTRISGVDFTSADYHDDVQYTADPFQYPNYYVPYVPLNYYDDVAYYMFSHSYVDQSVVDIEDRRDSPDNITVHNIGFCVDQPMLQHTADIQVDQYGKAIGMNLTAYSKAQVINAFHSIGLAIAEYTSYTAPVVSVDETNRVQSGDRIYMALFKPKEDEMWTGNLKKYGLRYDWKADCDGEKTEQWVVVDGSVDSGGEWVGGQEATDCEGYMLPNTSSFWSTVDDGGDVEKGGAGQILYNIIPTPTTILSDTPSFRTIHTLVGGLDVRVSTDTVTYSDLGVSTPEEAWEIINYLYGYTYAANVDGAPVYKRAWPLGAIVHSSPVLIDYFDENYEVSHRYIAVGANDGMLHVFDDANGKEIYAFVPPDILDRLQYYDPDLGNDHFYTVDGPINLVKNDKGTTDKADDQLLLIFGLRRGGQAYYALDVTSASPANWSIAWSLNTSTAGMAELGQSWGMPEFFKIQTGENTYKRLLIIPGGYDANEDRSTNDDYYLDATHVSAMGRGIYIIDLGTGLPLDASFFSGGSQFIYDSTITGLRNQMKYCFPADPTIALNPNNNTLLAAYITDLYGQVWKLSYVYKDENGIVVNKFFLNLIFRTNPMTDQDSAYENRASFDGYTVDDTTDPRGTINFIEDTNTASKWVVNPRRTFYSPEVSYAGNCYIDVPVLYMGTGDRENPTFTGDKTYVENGIYGFYDAHAYYMDHRSTGYTGTYDDLTQLFTEKDLLNVTCGALEPDVINVTNDEKNGIYTFLEKTAKGWYMLFDADGLSGCPSPDQDGYHTGEKAISPITLFNGVVYVPTYNPAEPAASNDICEYDGSARVYAVNYCDGNAVYDFYDGNNTTTTDENGNTTEEAKYTRRDRYLGVGTQIPSGIAVVIRHGIADGFVSVQGKIVTLDEMDFPSGLAPYYWRDTRRLAQ
ncbi:PilC/PilY family type IV pilus protein [Desulfosarcina cetonica]|uniref:PilC/PilY family type IV pilus protein n=1 Tax=Desulfosarcina cetonica TaxID=90730 RepID=UPI0009F9F1D0|nr:PilC/PilY family type IV pilus protein [Desulfosarcina cetonica]